MALQSQCNGPRSKNEENKGYPAVGALLEGLASRVITDGTSYTEQQHGMVVAHHDTYAF